MKSKLTYVALLLLLSVIHVQLHAQVDKKEKIGPAGQMEQLKKPGISNIPDCFCCDGAYNMTPPLISGPDVVKCGTTANFTWSYNCTGVVVGRNFSPFPPGTSGGGNNNSAWLNIPPGYTGTITLTVSFNCGGKSITGHKVFKVECCDCNLPPKFDITGPKALCVGENCKDEYVYTIPKMNDDKCYTYNWSISPAVSGFSGQGTNSIRIKCKELKVGTYTITSQIKCGDKVVNSTAQVVACQKPNPTFGLASNNSNPSMGTLTAGTTYSTHYWYIVTDNDNSGDYSNGDTYIGQITGNPANFSNLVEGKRYVFYHLVLNQCDGFACWSCSLNIYGPGPSFISTNPNGTPKQGKPVLQKLSEKSINLLKEIPGEFLKKLPADKVEMMRKTEYVGHVTLMK